jgi:hypothetical protein
MSINYKDNFSNYKENFESVPVVENPSANAISSTAESSNVSAPVVSISASASANANAISNANASGESEQILTVEQQLQESKTQNNALKMAKETLEESMRKQARALFLANNFYRIDDSSFNNEITFINDDFADVRLPENDFNGKTVISTQSEWNNLLTKAAGYKNLYKAGDVVIKPADYNISKDTICYQDYETHLSSDPNFKKKYPECMVCGVFPEKDYKNTKSWKNTKTNIHKVCLFNPNAPPSTSILNYDGCKKLCSGK